ncbi:MAG: MBL fold metallo-hydrolase [Thermoguttaceae bacterium]|nr:MBL fold metallo-hydrolase [Thermoguttaceae bacterium]
MKYSDFTIKQFVLSAIEENCYVLAAPNAGRECVVIDPGKEPDQVVSYLLENELEPVAILITHGHCDHFAGLAELKTRWQDAAVYIGANDEYKLGDPNANHSPLLFGEPIVAPDVDVLLADGEEFSVAGFTFKTIEIPGHSAGHVVYVLETESGAVVFCGDVIFAGSVGRADFEDGDLNALISSIAEKILTLPDSTFLCPGHGSITKVGVEKRCNPFLQNLE